jgi:cellulose synthase/poly-beta-1,6-N-acetylglucosamine synthase-like glycosyltransferase
LINLIPGLPIQLAAFATLAASWVQALALVAYLTAQALIVAYSSHRYVTLWRLWRLRRQARHEPGRAPERLPRVAVQLPVYNERLVVRRLIDAVAALDYPAEQLDIQVLDDSTDETTALAAEAVEMHRARGIPIRLLHRDVRTGFKAGALEAGLAATDADLVAVFDADFVPPPDFLTRLIPHFGDDRVGMVQARWVHLNRERSKLTAAQAVMLDAHFLLEHVARMGHGLFFNFNGTAGVWRRTCIEDAGGWSHDTLTEDLDLSYRAQLRGWRFVFDPGVEAPAELPADMEALKSQQRRWTKGSIQTSRKLLPKVLSGSLPLAVKVEALFHLTNNVTYPLLLALALTLVPVLLGTSTAPAALVWTLQVGVILLGIVPVIVFLAAGQRAAGIVGWRAAQSVLGALVLGVGLSVNNARAVFEGLGPGIGRWERTPKSGDGLVRPTFTPYAAVSGWSGRTELALAAYFTGSTLLAWTVGAYRAIPFIALLIVGFAIVGVGSLRSSLRADAIATR